MTNMDWKPWDGVFHASEYGGPVWDKHNPIVAFRNDKMEEYPVAYSRIKYDWRLVGDFTSAMEITKMEQGRSSFRIWMRAEDGILYPAFLADLELLIQHGTITKGYVAPEKYSFVKRGANYGIVLTSRL